jgi:hypothetical protein
MDKRIIFTRPVGGVSVVIPCRCIGEDHLSEDQLVARAWNRLPQEAVNPTVIFTADLPQDRDFRNAWEHGGDKVRVNMDRAREIYFGRIRKARDAALMALDIETIKASGKGDTGALATVEAQKQLLRDLPEAIDLNVAKSPEELKDLWPKELSGE